MRPQPAQPEARPRVWIVDDSPLEAQQAARALASWYDVDTLPDGNSALERLTTHAPPDVLVLDWILPDLSGVDLCRFARSSVATHSLPILLISSRREAQDVIEGFASGADDYLPKPYEPSELVARVASLVRARQLLVRAERAETSLRAMLEHLPDAVVALDARGYIAQVNGEAARVFGQTARQLHGRVVNTILPMITVGRHGPVLDEDETLIGDRIFSLHVRQLPADAVASTVIVLHDVTATRRAADAARDEARRKDEFLAMLGHELRNPLAAIASASQLLQVAGADTRIASRANEVMNRQITHMVRLVDDLLDVSRITRGRIELRRERIDVREALKRSVDSVAQLAQAHKHRVEIALDDTALPVDADPTRLEQVFTNLLTNAVKYTPPGGEIHVSAAYLDGYATIVVKDNGVGIPADALPRVFDLFTQVDRSIDRSQGGLGIGLTVVRGIVELHGGHVDASSDGVGKGSEFRVTLPLVASQPLGAKPMITTTGCYPRPKRLVNSVARVLVVDDHPDNATLLAELLQRAGFDVEAACSAHEALEKIGIEPPDAVILDLGLPDIDGYELASRIRAITPMKDARLIALSGYGQASDLERSAAAGIDRHLVKPASAEALFAALQVSGAEEAAG